MAEDTRINCDGSLSGMHMREYFFCLKTERNVAIVKSFFTRKIINTIRNNQRGLSARHKILNQISYLFERWRFFFVQQFCINEYYTVIFFKEDRLYFTTSNVMNFFHLIGI